MTTQPSDWAVTRAFRRAFNERGAFDTVDEALDWIDVAARDLDERHPRELDASGDAPRAAEAGTTNSAQISSEVVVGDAARYRWLRGNLLWAKSYDGYVRWTVEIRMPEPGIHEGHPPVAETLDAAIDAAMGAAGAD